MFCTPKLPLCHQRKRPKVSVILIDWGVRESFHSIHYLNQQTADREDYELVWVEFYDRQPEALREMATRPAGGGPALDRWMVLSYPDDYCFHKHRMYNVGILLASGDVCVICDSDAVFPPTFIESTLRAFDETPRAVVHLDEVRNTSPDYYPFNYPSIEQIKGPGCINWAGTTTLGLNDSPDILHHANYGACMAALRKDLLAIGGADEHIDFLGYICGPYDLTFRLRSYGVLERWLRDEYLYHTWHPNQYGWNTDYQGPHDGLHLSLRALEARGTRRVRPCLKNPWLSRAWWWGGVRPEQLLRLVGERPEPTWRSDALPGPPDRAYWIEVNYFGFDIFHYAGSWYALRSGQGRLDPGKLRRGQYAEVWQAAYEQELLDKIPIDHAGWEHLHKGPLPKRLWRRFRAEPLHRVPLRLFRKARYLMTTP